MADLLEEKREGESFKIEDWMTAPLVEYNLMDVYKEQVKPLADQLHNLCRELGMPMVIRACISQTVEGHQVFQLCNLGEEIGRIPADIIAMSVMEDFDKDTLRHMDHIRKAGLIRNTLANNPNGVGLSELIIDAILNKR